MPVAFCSEIDEESSADSRQNKRAHDNHAAGAFRIRLSVQMVTGNQPAGASG